MTARTLHLGLLAGVVACVPPAHAGLRRHGPYHAELPDPGPELDRRIDELERIVHANEKDAHSLALLGVAYRKLATVEGRARSVRRLEEAIDLQPDVADTYIALGYTRLEQKFYGYAAEAFSRAGELAPNRWVPFLEAGICFFRNWCQERQNPKWLELAGSRLDHAWELDPDNEEIAFDTAIVRRERGEQAGARRVAAGMLRADSTSAPAHLLAGLLHFDDGFMELSEAEFARGLDLLGPLDSSPFYDVSLILGKEKSSDFTAVDPMRRYRWVEDYWSRHDPTPTTPANESRLEHYARVLLSDAYFSHPGPGLRGWETTRGQTYIRYGLPQVVEGDPGYIGAADMQAEAETVGKLIKVGYPMQYWTYAVPGTTFTLAFEDRSLDGNYQLPAATGPGSLAEADLEIRDRIPQLRRWHYPGEDLPLVVQACRFRGHRGQIRLEFFFELPGPEIARYATSQEKGFVGEKRLLVVDARGRRRGPRIENVAYPLPKQDEAGSALPPVDAMWTDVKPGRNAVAMAVEEWRSRVRFTWRDTLEVGSLQDHGLAMSDIVFARSVERERGERVSGSTRGDLVVIPHPATTFHQDESAFFYCEVYGLTPADTSGTCDYRLEYRIEEVTTDGKGKRSFLTRWLRGPAGGEPRSVLYRFDRRSSASDAQDYVAIDPGAFAQGLYRITFTATDTNGGGTASRSAEFRVAD